MSKPEYVYVIYIQTTPEKVWRALQDPEMTKDYWGRRTNRSDWQQGSPWRHESYDDSSDVAVAGTVVESKPPHRLVITWARPDDVSKPEKTSRVAFDIEDAFGAVKLTVTHSELDAEMLRAISGGWPAILSSLKTMLETGAAMPMTQRSWKG
ncbi:activator of HSP90 ATPase [Afipia sp. P52-10]|jgi:uncharacterized protein YndB with AHSA1/START domain|uniref:SRPBCC family protein n=1 Tax=Afipia sp. P52-10 TaxID=1429916 RepID=UPI0003DF4594|nr:SRPBCC family protein [Afipia sp. P52-10]ETR78658.1 activator of HSP90 ATPase [Afipia sp. P52-10]